MWCSSITTNSDCTGHVTNCSSVLARGEEMPSLKKSWDKLKGNSTNFTHSSQFTQHEEGYSSWKNSGIMYFVSVMEVLQVWENNHDNVIYFTLGLMKRCSFHWIMGIVGSGIFGALPLLGDLKSGCLCCFDIFDSSSCNLSFMSPLT